MCGRSLPPGILGFASLSLDDRFVTGTVTVSSEMVDRFADLSGDHFALHFNDKAAQELGFPRRVAHGLLVLFLIDGLKNQAPTQLRAVASLGWDIAFQAPVLVGDTLRASLTLQSARPTRDGLCGIAVFQVEAQNQKDETVQAGRLTLLLLP